MIKTNVYNTLPSIVENYNVVVRQLQVKRNYIVVEIFTNAQNTIFKFHLALKDATLT